ncbi:uncharacterized protein LOC133192393 [Saccostrea echinata]|uniref:uncharacterized protein LOC133192393 n=1 Tax=Saccostrea echinata TaxID=191078 RepID=UPI002A80C84E|nr:uncharacterized protein LOC133192393 [Saccostrea echinata]
MIHREAGRKLTNTEEELYEGPVYYISHHEVLKPGSKSTPLRIVFNSSASFIGHVLNSYWMKGPKVLNDLISVLLKFRENQSTLVGDISKMYNSVRLSTKDQHTHRFLWRNYETNRQPDHYTLTSVPFGDRPSGAIAMIALRKTAALLENEYPRVADVIKNIAIWMTLLPKNQDKVADGIKLLNTETEKILGLIWRPQDDVFTFKVQLDFTDKGKQKGSISSITSCNVSELSNLTTLTKRMELKQVAGVCYPLELCGAVLSARLREKIVNSLGFSFEKIIHLVDSAIVRAQIQKESYGFGTFVANRIAEIQSKTCKSDWYWIPSYQNPADFTTRITSPSVIDSDSMWQKGPEFLYQPFEKWPVKQEVEVKEIPDVLVRHTEVKVTEEKSRTVMNVAKLIDLNRISTLQKILKLTSLLQLIRKKHTIRGIVHCLLAEELRDAENIWILHVQEDLPDDVMYRFKRLRPHLTPDGIIRVGQRMNKWTEDNWNMTAFALIPSSHPFAEFIVKAFYERDHAGLDVTLAKIRSMAATDLSR